MSSVNTERDVVEDIEQGWKEMGWEAGPPSLQTVILMTVLMALFTTLAVASGVSTRESIKDIQQTSPAIAAER